MIRLAINGGSPVRATVLGYGRQWIDSTDIAQVIETLQSDWLTTGPKTAEFEKSLAEVAGTSHAAAVSSGTAALHCAMHAIGVGPGDEVIVPAITFAATANCAVYQNAAPVFVDVDPETLLIDPSRIETKITARTKAVICVDYAGQPCDYDALKAIVRRHGLKIVADACHSLGALYNNKPAASLADIAALSFHPVKHITTGEGGAVVTDNPDYDRRVRTFRNHGITRDHRSRNSWFYEMEDLGFNYRLSDIQCALGISQLKKLDAFIDRRRRIAEKYDAAFAAIPALGALKTLKQAVHAYHLYVVRLCPEHLRVDRKTVFEALRAEGIGVNVHYVPVYLHPFYQRKFSLKPGLCPQAEKAYEQMLTLPLFPQMSDADVNDVICATQKVMEAFSI